MATPETQTQAQPAVRCMTWLGEWADIPQDIAKCPECGSQLEAWVDGWSERGGYSVDVSCKKSGLMVVSDHLCYQSDWQPVLDVVKAWANSPNAGSELPREL